MHCRAAQYKLHNMFITYRVHAMKIDPLPTFHRITQASVKILLNCVYVT